MARAPQPVEPERRLALLKAAFREVAEKGFSEVTLDDIAKRAGVSKGVTLYYFDSPRRTSFGRSSRGSSIRSTSACGRRLPAKRIRSLA
jgi:hypothetical protein